MSSKVQFTLFLGDGTVDNGLNGVELNNFKKTTKYIDRSAQKSFESIYIGRGEGVYRRHGTHPRGSWHPGWGRQDPWRLGWGR